MDKRNETNLISLLSSIDISLGRIVLALEKQNKGVDENAIEDTEETQRRE